MLEVRQHPARGRGLYTTRLIQGGEVVLQEGPLMLVAAHTMKDTTCAMCLRHLAGVAGRACKSLRQINTAAHLTTLVVLTVPQ
eukprot:1162016-Pelagomonas_calceolata.AAC.14